MGLKQWRLAEQAYSETVSLETDAAVLSKAWLGIGQFPAPVMEVFLLILLLRKLAASFAAFMCKLLMKLCHS